MWIAVKIIVAAITAGMRIWIRFLPPKSWGYKPIGSPGGPLYFTTTGGGKPYTKYAAPINSNCEFELTPNGAAPMHTMKMQSAHKTAPMNSHSRTKLSCDQKDVIELFRQSDEVRARALEIFEMTANRIEARAGHLWVRFDSVPSSKNPGDAILSLANLLANRQRISAKEGFRRPTHLFIALVAAICAYTATGLFEYPGISFHVYPYRAALLGLFTGLVVFSVLLPGVLVLLKKSSRYGRILFANTLILLVVCPLWGIQIISDLNRGLDRKKPVVVYRKLAKTEARRVGDDYHDEYYLTFDGSQRDDGYDVPDELRVAKYSLPSGFRHEGDVVRIEIGPGWLGQPWYRSFTIGRSDHAFGMVLQTISVATPAILNPTATDANLVWKQSP